MSEKVLFEKTFCLNDVLEIKDLLIVFSPAIGKSILAGEQFDNPILLENGKNVNVNMVISVET